MNWLQLKLILTSVTLVVLSACHSSSTPTPPPAPAADLAIFGIVSDGPVSGGWLFAFTASQIEAALDSVTEGGDRAAELLAAGPIASLQRDPDDGDIYQMTIPAEFADSLIYLVFDNAGAEDEAFRDTPPNLEAFAGLGAAGSSQRVNVTLHTTLIGIQLRAGSGGFLGSEHTNVVAALGRDKLGRDLFPDGGSPVDYEDNDTNHAASTYVGRLVRAASIFLDVPVDEVIEALALDTADAEVDGEIPVFLNPDMDQTDTAAAVAAFISAGDADEELAAFAIGPCSTAAVALRQACAVDIIDDNFEARAGCADTSDEEETAECIAEAEIELEEEDEACDEVFEARLALCESLADTAHDPEFGPEFADQFVDPLQIGGAVDVNPYFPLVVGNRWVYEGGEEVITVEVKNETKLVNGITCLTVNDVVTVDGVLIEDTDDWFAQDLAGNIWYCGEIAENYELFEGDVPQEAELVDVEGSWKDGRDGAEAGILIPFAPEAGTVIRQEVFYGEAEDAIEVLSISATETAPAGACDGNCLQTLDFTPLEPDSTANKFYAPGIGLIVELEDEERVELVEFSQPD